jgi:hypothetical protein
MNLRRLSLLPLLLLFAACNNPVGQDDHARDVAGVELYDVAQPDVRVARTVGGVTGQWEGALPAVRVGETRTFQVRWVSSSGQAMTLGSSYSSRARFQGDGPLVGDLVRENATLRISTADGRVGLTGRAVGDTHIVVLLWHGSHEDAATSPLRVQVVAE